MGGETNLHITAQFYYRFCEKKTVPFLVQWQFKDLQPQQKNYRFAHTVYVND